MNITAYLITHKRHFGKLFLSRNGEVRDFPLIFAQHQHACGTVCELQHEALHDDWLIQEVSVTDQESYLISVLEGLLPRLHADAQPADILSVRDNLQAAIADAKGGAA